MMGMLASSALETLAYKAGWISAPMKPMEVSSVYDLASQFLISEAESMRDLEEAFDVSIKETIDLYGADGELLAHTEDLYVVSSATRDVEEATNSGQALTDPDTYVAASSYERSGGDEGYSGLFGSEGYVGAEAYRG
mgnify:FL=1